MSNSNNEFVLKLMALLDKQKSKSQINTDIKDLEKTLRKLKLTATLSKGTTKTELNQTIKQLESQLRQIKLQAKIDNRQLNREINNALRNVSARDISLNINSNGERLNAQVRRAVLQAREFVERNPISMNIDLKREKLLNQLTAFTNKHTKINESSYWLGEAERLRTVISSVTNREELRNATDQLQVFTTGVRATGYATVSITDKIKGMLGNVLKVCNYFGLAFTAVNKFRQSLNTLKTNDTILTEISKTSEMTKKQLQELGDEAFKVASKYGQSSGNYLLGVQEMARSGYETLSKELGELSLLAQSAGDMTADSANNYLLATDAAYKYSGSVEKLNAALDGANYISNKNSASLTDIADATRVSASFAANAGVAIDELTAAEATMIAVTKRSGSEIGRAFRSIVLNLQQVSGEFDGEVIDEEQLKKVEDRCHSLGVELEYMNNGVPTLRNTMEVLKELAEVYNSLPDNSAEKQGLISDLGGKYHANALSALLSRWDMYEKMLGEFSQGTGSALEEANKTADSWEGRLAQLQNSWDSFVSSLTNKNAVKGGVSFLDNTIQAFEKLTDTVGALPVMLTTVNASMAALNKNYGITQIYNKDTHKIDLQGNFMGVDITAYKTQVNHFREASVAMETWNNRLIDGTANIDDFGLSVVQNNEQLKAYLQTTSADAPASLAGYRAYLNAAGVSTDTLRLKTILLNSAISLGIGIAIQAAVQGITYLIQREEELRQATEEAANAYKDSASSIEDYASRYQELHKALIAAKGNEEETYSIKKQLLALQTELNDEFGDEYGAINLVTDAYKDQTEAIKSLNKEKAQTFLNENKEGIDQAEKEMTKERHYNLSYTGMIATTDKGKALKEIAEKYKDQGMSILDEGDGGVTFSVHLETDAQSAYDTINAFENDLRDKAKELGDEHMFEDVLDISSDSLNKAKKTIDEYRDTYKQALTAEIVSDDDKAKTYGEALDAVEAYNEAVLKSENPYDDQNVTQAKQNLDAIKDSIQGNEEEWGKYSVIFDDIFSQADTRLITFNEALQNDSGLQKLAGDLEGLSDVDLQALDESVGENDSFDKLKESAEGYGVSVSELIDTLIRLGYVQGEIQSETSNIENPVLTFEEAWADSFTSEKDAVKELGDTLLGLAEKGRLTKETFNEADSNAGGYFKNLGISADEAVSKINALVDEAKQLSSMSSQISSMADALSTKREDGYVSADTLAGFDVEVRGLESWDRFQSVLGSTTSSYKECQEAANALATEWINSSGFLAQLTDENEEYYKTQLKAMGIENYEEIIGYAHALNEAKEVLSQSSLELGNTTQDEIEALIAEGQYSELTANMILALYDAKIAEQGVSLDTAADCANLIALAGDTDRTSQSIQLLIQLMEIYNGLESGTYDNNEIARGMALAKVVAIKAQLEALANGEVKDMEIEPTVKLGNRGKSSAKSAGKKAGDAYKEGLKEALSDMESVISGVTGKLDDRISDINAEKDAALESIDEQKEAIESAKDAAVSALEEERQKRLDVIEAQRKQIEQTIKAKQKVIDDINAEIKAMQDANAERQRELDLQRAKFELERKEQQRVKLVYTKDKGFVYKNDSKGIADAREQVRQIELEIEIVNKEKEISLIEKEIDLLEDKLDLLSEQENDINDYYDKLISETEAFYDSQLKALEKQRKETEKYYESITKGLENQKSKFQELTELLEKAELSAKLKQLGIDEEALLNGSEEEFNKLKEAYLNIVYELNKGNDDVLNALRDLSGYEGTAPTMLSDSNQGLDDMNTKLGTSNTNVGNVNSSLDKTASTTSTVASNVGEISSNISESTGLVGEEQTAFSNLKTVIDEVIKAIEQKTKAVQEEQAAVGIATSDEMANFLLLKAKIEEVKGTLDIVNNTVATMDRRPIDNLTTAFQLLYNQIVLVSNELSVNAENSIASSIQALNDISLEEGIIAQFTNLKTAIDSVTAAISGGGGESSGGEGQGGSGSKQSGESGSKGSKGNGEGGGGDSLTGAIEQMGETANTIIGEPDAEGDGTVIGEFGSMETAVNDVRDAIGTEGSEGQGGNSGGEGDDTLVGSIEYLGDKTEEEMGESGGDGIIGRFEEFRDVIGSADEHVKSISDGLDEIDGKEVSCTIKINIIRTESGGGGGAGASEGEAALLGSMNLESGTYNAKYTGNAHVSGTANVTGNWGVRKPGKTLVGELGQEIWVHSADGTFETVGDNGPEWIRTKKNDLIFNHLQTRELLKKGNLIGRGKALADGTALAKGSASDGSWIGENGHRYRDLQPGDDGYYLVKAFEPLVQKVLNGEEEIVSNAVFEGQRRFEKWTHEVMNNTAINNVANNTKNVQQPVTIQIGDINLTGVQDVNGLAQAIKTRLPGKMMQEYFKN